MSDQSKDKMRAVAALNRARQLSSTLSEAARLARVSGRGRNAYSGGGFAARKGAGAFRLFSIITFVLGVVIPSLLSGIYFAFLASDQYVAQAGSR